MTATAATEPRKLTAAEQRQLDGLLSKAGLSLPAPAAPGVVVGDPYVALTNIVVPRRNDPQHGADLVPAGETVHLTEEEAKLFLRCDPGRDGRRIPVIRRLSDGEAAERGRPLPRHLSGVLHAPPAPKPGDSGPRPDPPGSSRIMTYEDARIPETREPQPGSEQDPASVVDALDIAVSR